jgi:hypothetical protein
VTEVKVLIYNGKGNRSHFLYGEVVDAKTDNLMICASAKYVTDAIKEHGYKIVELVVEK